MLWFSCLFFSFLCAARCEDALEDEIASLDELIRLQVGQLRLPYSELIVTDRSLPGIAANETQSSEVEEGNRFETSNSTVSFRAEI
jgi:hypothetical protein